MIGGEYKHTNKQTNKQIKKKINSIQLNIREELVIIQTPDSLRIDKSEKETYD